MRIAVSAVVVGVAGHEHVEEGGRVGVVAVPAGAAHLEVAGLAAVQHRVEFAGIVLDGQAQCVLPLLGDGHGDILVDAGGVVKQADAFHLFARFSQPFFRLHGVEIHAGLVGRHITRNGVGGDEGLGGGLPQPGHMAGDGFAVDAGGQGAPDLGIGQGIAVPVDFGPAVEQVVIGAGHRGRVHVAPQFLGFDQLRLQGGVLDFQHDVQGPVAKHPQREGTVRHHAMHQADVLHGVLFPEMRVLVEGDAPAQNPFVQAVGAVADEGAGHEIAGVALDAHRACEKCAARFQGCAVHRRKGGEGQQAGEVGRGLGQGDFQFPAAGLEPDQPVKGFAGAFPGFCRRAQPGVAQPGVLAEEIAQFFRVGGFGAGQGFFQRAGIEGIGQLAGVFAPGGEILGPGDEVHQTGVTAGGVGQHDPHPGVTEIFRRHRVAIGPLGIRAHVQAVGQAVLGNLRQSRCRGWLGLATPEGRAQERLVNGADDAEVGQRVGVAGVEAAAIRPHRHHQGAAAPGVGRQAAVGRFKREPGQPEGGEEDGGKDDGELLHGVIVRMKPNRVPGAGMARSASFFRPGRRPVGRPGKRV